MLCRFLNGHSQYIKAANVIDIKIAIAAKQNRFATDIEVFKAPNYEKIFNERAPPPSEVQIAMHNKTKKIETWGDVLKIHAEAGDLEGVERAISEIGEERKLVRSENRIENDNDDVSVPARAMASLLVNASEIPAGYRYGNAVHTCFSNSKLMWDDMVTCILKGRVAINCPEKPASDASMGGGKKAEHGTVDARVDDAGTGINFVSPKRNSPYVDDDRGSENQDGASTCWENTPGSGCIFHTKQGGNNTVGAGPLEVFGGGAVEGGPTSQGSLENGEPRQRSIFDPCESISAGSEPQGSGLFNSPTNNSVPLPTHEKQGEWKERSFRTKAPWADKKWSRNKIRVGRRH